MRIFELWDEIEDEQYYAKMFVKNYDQYLYI